MLGPWPVCPTTRCTLRPTLAAALRAFKLPRNVRPVFNETLQLGFVVRDLEATVRRFVDDYGIGPWHFTQIDLGEANNYREYGQPAERSNRIAVATVVQVMWELIEPLEENKPALGEVQATRAARAPT
jgi:hypothetical protein